ncbi:unnamed protein product [Orchesella dallaii]|uniref:Uncharacterized protein n=1 Tax=Orchesella dallaii TaxID=48710 RepID=A0ABP1Q729_9HEXA
MESFNNSSEILEIAYSGKEGLELNPTFGGYFAPIAITFLSSLSTIALFYFLPVDSQSRETGRWWNSAWVSSRSTPLPGYGILGDKVNELLEVFLDALAIYVHNDKSWDCSRRMLCEANQRAADYGPAHGVLMYFLSLTVSAILRDQRVSESMEAMRKGRHGLDCRSSYPHCPFSL